MQLIASNSKKAGRNDLCPCGSGNKYKKCCLDKDSRSSHQSLNVDAADVRRTMESTLHKIKKIAENGDMSPEELKRLLNGFVGRKIDDIDAEFTKITGNSDPKSQAEDLLEQAYEAGSCAKIVETAKKALAIYPHLPDAWILIAEHSSGSPQAFLPYCEKAVEAGRQDLGEKFFEENKGHFWGMIETRPFMRAKAHLAQCLWDLGREDEAIVQYQECLELNPNDNQGLRDRLVGCLLAKDRVTEAEEVLKKYKEDCGAFHAFNKALCLFKLHGPESKKASKQLVAAIVANSHIPKYLSGKKKIPDHDLNGYALGSKEEAIFYAEDCKTAWQRTPGALDWLSNFA